MKAIDFSQANAVLNPPEDNDAGDMGKFEPIPVSFNQTNSIMMSVWYPTVEERMVIAEGGCIALFTLAVGGQHPPVKLSAAAMDYKEEEVPETAAIEHLPTIEQEEIDVAIEQVEETIN